MLVPFFFFWLVITLPFDKYWPRFCRGPLSYAGRNCLMMRECGDSGRKQQGGSQVVIPKYFQPRIHWTPRSLAAGLKRPGREADHSYPSGAEVKNAWICSFTPQ